MNDYVVEILNRDSNTPLLKINGLYIHSKYRAIDEAKKIASSNFEKHYTFVLFGYGLGLVVDELLELITEEHIIIIDPLVKSGELKMNEHHINHSHVHFWDKSYNYTLLYQINGVSLGMKTLVKVITTPYYDKLFVDYYKEVLNDVRNYLVRARVNNNTISLYAEKWQKNVSMNLLNILKDETLKNLEKVYDCPVVIASGGPSLTKQLPLLKQIQKKVIIIAAGTTIKTLLKYGIKPDYVVSIDGSETNYNSFKDLNSEGLNLNDITLLYSPFNHWAIRPLFNEGYCFTTTLYNSIATYIYKTTGKDIPQIVGGGTVAHFAFSIATVITKGPIGFIGQDLAFTNNVTHAEGNQGRKTIEEIRNKKTTLFEIEGYNGDKVTTNGAFLSMKQTFEEMARFYFNGVEIYNCTEGGAKLKGFNQMPFVHFVKQFVMEDVDKVRSSKVDKIDLESIIFQLNKEIELSKELQNKANNGIEILDSNKSDTHFSESILEQLDNVDEEILQLVKEVQMECLIQPLLLKIRGAFLEKPNETPQEAYNRSFNQSKCLYEEVLEMIEKSILNIESVLEILTDEEKLNEYYRK